MLSEDAKRELKAAARSVKLRAECEQARTARDRPVGTPPDIEQFIKFLSEASRLFPSPPPRPLVSYTNVRL